MENPRCSYCWSAGEFCWHALLQASWKARLCRASRRSSSLTVKWSFFWSRAANSLCLDRASSRIPHRDYTEKQGFLGFVHLHDSVLFSLRPFSRLPGRLVSPAASAGSNCTAAQPCPGSGPPAPALWSSPHPAGPPAPWSSQSGGVLVSFALEPPPSTGTRTRERHTLG